MFTPFRERNSLTGFNQPSFTSPSYEASDEQHKVHYASKAPLKAKAGRGSVTPTPSTSPSGRGSENHPPLDAREGGEGSNIT
ncbi:MAG: hypothetical protein WC650_01750 [Candidatus Doudnabacteria bacterium]